MEVSIGRRNDSESERRPPIYNSEDYIFALQRFSTVNDVLLHDTVLKEKIRTVNCFDERSKIEKNEMGLKQFSNVSELLLKLKSDLTCSFPSFVREFISDRQNGVSILLEVLKVIQESQNSLSGTLHQSGHRVHQIKRALLDEFEALSCLKICCRSYEGSIKMVEHHSGLFSIAVALMSSYSKSRIIALQCLSRLTDVDKGHRGVSDAISMLRLRFGEPVRFKFLIGMLNSVNSSAFQISCLRFLNRFIETSMDTREKIMIQCELEEAGLDVSSFNSSATLIHRVDLLKEEVNRWNQNLVDVDGLIKKLLETERANRKLREDISVLTTKHDKLSDHVKELEKLFKESTFSQNPVQILPNDGFTTITSSSKGTVINCSTCIPIFDSGLSSNSSTVSNTPKEFEEEEQNPYLHVQEIQCDDQRISISNLHKRFYELESESNTKPEISVSESALNISESQSIDKNIKINFIESENENCPKTKSRTRHGRPRDVMRRAESLSIHRKEKLSSSSFSSPINRASSEERLNFDFRKSFLSKSKSLEAVKAKYASNFYDWRIDTPFWNKSITSKMSLCSKSAFSVYSSNSFLDKLTLPNMSEISHQKLMEHPSGLY